MFTFSDLLIVFYCVFALGLLLVLFLHVLMMMEERLLQNKNSGKYNKEKHNIDYTFDFEKKKEDFKYGY